MTDAIALAHLSVAIKREAHGLGFDNCRIAPLATPPHADFFDAWIDAGRAGEMAYLERNRDKRRHPASLTDAGTPVLRSAIVLAANYHQFDLAPEVRDDPSRGLIASYAWGDDYHEIMRPLLYQLDAFIRSQTGRQTLGKCLVDTGPLLERDWALNAGVGFIGKNCCIIHPTDGSWLILSAILIPEELTYDPPPTLADAPPTPPEAVLAGLPAGGDHARWSFPTDEASTPPSPHSQFTINHSQLTISSSPLATCGRCTRCLVACPTDAFVGPYHLDPQRCISYWTIEAKGPIPRELRPLFGNRIFGCDICQEVCPYNHGLAERSPSLPGLRARAERVAPPLLEGFQPAHPYWLEDGAFRARFRRSPVLRARRRGMARNVCVALGNWADPVTTGALSLALHDPEALVRGHAAWALGQVHARRRHPTALQLLNAALAHEPDAWVQEEIRLARTPP